MNEDIWAFKRQDTARVLQAIWNKVYEGSAKDGRQKVKFLVEPSTAVYQVVRQLVPNSEKYTHDFQSVQRATEWRNAVGSTGLAVVADFLARMKVNTSEACRDAAIQSLDNDRYVYLKTKDVVEKGVTTVRVICYIYPYAKTECRLSVLAAIVAHWSSSQWRSVGSISRALSKCLVTFPTMTFPLLRLPSARPR